MTYSLSIALGAAVTAGAVARGGPPRLLDIDGEGTSMPSAVWLDPAGGWLAGRPALARAAERPECFQRAVVLTAGEGTLLLGDRLVPVADALGALITRVLAAARAAAGADPADVRFTHPAHWRGPRCEVLERAAAAAGLGDVTLIPEPVAAATRLGRHAVAAGERLAILDIGGTRGTATVLTRTPGGFAVAGHPVVSDRVGGDRIDQLIVAHLGQGAPGAHPDWPRLLSPDGQHWRRAALGLRDAVRGAKEQLSGRMAAQVAIPALGIEVQLTRAELDSLMLPVIDEAIGLLEATAASAGSPLAGLSAVWLIGGTSRSPLVADRLWERLGIQPEVPGEPESVSVLGAAEGIAQHRMAGGSPFRGRLAGAIVNPIWKAGISAAAGLVLSGDGTTVTVTDSPRAGAGASALAAAAERDRLAGTPGYAGLDLVTARVLDRDGGLQRRYLVAEGGQQAEYVQRYLEIGERWLTLTAPERATAVLDSLRIEAPRADPARQFELRVGADLPRGWQAAEFIELSRGKNGLRLTGESFPAERAQVTSRHDEWCARTFPPPRYAELQRGPAGFLGRHEAISTTFRDTAQGLVTRVWTGLIDGRGYRVTATAPGRQRLVLPLIESQLTLFLS